MVTYEGNDFIVEYDAKNEAKAQKLVTILEEEMQRILDFFDLDSLSQKKRIKLYSTLLEYQTYLTSMGIKYLDWMIADTNNGDINILTIEECRRTKSHQYMTMKEYKNVVVHEFVHACQQEINPDASGCEWFWEALALNLAGPFMNPVKVDCTKEELMQDYLHLSDGYPISLTIGRYLLKYYEHEKILDYVKNPEHLSADLELILHEVKLWQLGSERVPR